MTLNIYTIVLNGMPWLTWHIDQFRKLHVPWKWTIVHGISDPGDCTAWCNRIEAQPDDGTLGYLDELAAENPRQVTVIKQDRWPSKIAMCNAAIATFKEQGLLLQVDADELWTAEQLRLMPAIMEAHPTADSAYFMARIWVGPRRFCCTMNGWANQPYEWMRLWRFTPGQKLLRHEPPFMEGQKCAVSKESTSKWGLVFDHKSYVLREQIQFKERFYGPQWSVAAWDALQTMRGPVELSAVLPFVQPKTMSYEI